jgi:hypothetical protein
MSTTNPHWRATGPKPRVRFCWVCSRQLYGRQFAEVEIDGLKRIVHKACASGMPAGWQGTEADFYKHAHERPKGKP